MMRNIASRLALTATLLFALTCTWAQEKLTIDKVYKVTLRNSGTIVENEQIKGYYFFYMSDKVDKRTNEYTLQILDANLNKLKDVKFQDSKNIALLESSYNGSSILFMFYDSDQKMLDYRLYTTDGAKSFSYSKPLDKRSDAYFKQALSQTGDDEGSENQNIFDIEGKGFVAITPLRENKNYTYEVNFYASDKKRSWTFNPIEEGKFAQAQYLGANDSIAVIEVLSKDKLMSKEMESSLVGINLSNGRKAFEIRTRDGKNQLYPMNITTMKGSSEFLLIGPYFEGDDRVLQDKSDGLGIWLMNNKGKIVKSKYASWEKDLSKFVKLDRKGRVDGLGYVYFHNIVQTEDGKIFAIGEGYKKAASAGGIAMSVLTQSYNSNVTKLVVTDMLMLELNEKFELTNASIYEKNNNNFNLNGADFANPHTLALVAKAFGAFDYAYTQMGKNKASFVSSYTDYERSKDYKGLTFNSISYYNGKLTTDKINLKTSASNLHLLPAKPGFVLIMEYFKKDKRLDLRLEKIN
jgi:hypothetical protein